MKEKLEQAQRRLADSERDIRQAREAEQHRNERYLSQKQLPLGEQESVVLVTFTRALRELTRGAMVVAGDGEQSITRARQLIQFQLSKLL